MVFTRKRKISVDISLSIDSNVITEVNSTKFLGVFLDNKLTWKKHIDYIVAKLSRGIGLISKARKLLNADALLTLYYSFLYPYLCYCNHVWGSTYITNLQKLVVLQKKIVRMISGSGYRDHTDPLFTNLSLIKFVDLNKYMIGKFMFRYHVDDVPHIFEGYFSKISDIHDYETRKMMGCMHQILVKPLFRIEDPLFGIWLSTLVSILMFQKQFLLNHWRNALWMVHFKS